MRTVTEEARSMEHAIITLSSRKTPRACLFCQRSHMTCSCSRPCERCIKRGLADQCVDGFKKRAKYLLEDDKAMEAEISTASISNGMSNLHTGAEKAHHGVFANNTSANFPDKFKASDVNTACGLSDSNADQRTIDMSLLSGMTMSFDVRSSFIMMLENEIDASLSILNEIKFMSETAAMEYLTLCEISGVTPELTSSQSHLSINIARPGLPALVGASKTASNHSLQTPSLAGYQPNIDLNFGMTAFDAFIPSSTNEHTPIGVKKTRPVDPGAVYDRVREPYNHTEGFHSLVTYVKENFNKEDATRVCEALARFRPSFISLITHLTESDLIFMEKCFQRTVLEYEQLLQTSGTPSCLWRRTGELVFVGKEFSLLTQWTKEQLLGKKTFIYELMDNKSAVEYWEKYAAVSFDSNQQCVISNCILMRPGNRPISCAFSFTIKKDIFDVPLVVIGSFLPILRSSQG